MYSRCDTAAANRGVIKNAPEYEVLASVAKATPPIRPEAARYSGLEMVDQPRSAIPGMCLCIYKIPGEFAEWLCCSNGIRQGVSMAPALIRMRGKA